MNNTFLKQAIRKNKLRIIPLLFAVWFVNYLDRANISFAALQMNQELNLDPKMFGFAVGIFYLGYILFEVPSNLMMHRFGARVWLARIIITWGVISIGIAFVSSPIELYTARFLLGIAEAGFLPAVMYYLTSWFPKESLGKAIALVFCANTLSLVIGAPLSALLMTYSHDLLGLSGWRWMMMLEGIPAILLSILVWLKLPNTPDKATWLSPQEQQSLISTLKAQTEAHATMGPLATSRFFHALKSPIVWLLGLLYFCIGIGFFGLTNWLPQVIKQITSFSMMEIGLLSAIPFLLGSIAMWLNSQHSDRTQERRWHVAIPLLIGAMGLASSGYFSAIPWLAFTAICVAAIGLVGSLSVFWTIPSTFLSGPGAAGGMALINSISALSGFFAPWIIGIIRNQSTDFSLTLYVLSASVIIAGLLAIFLPYPSPYAATQHRGATSSQG